METPDPNERFRDRRRKARRRKRIQRTTGAIGILLAGGAVALGARGLDSGDDPAAKPAAAKKKVQRPERPAPPAEIRGGRVDKELPSFPGTLAGETRGG